MDAIKFLEAHRATNIDCVMECTGFMILTHAIVYLRAPEAYTRQGSGEWVMTWGPAQGAQGAAI
jgi:hypothetical protein